MKTDLIKDGDFERLPGIKDMLEAIELPTRVERAKEEDFVIREFLRHGNSALIVRKLNERNSEITFKREDLIEFFSKFKEVIQYQNDMNKKSAVKRIMRTKEGLTHELLDLAILSKNLAVKYDNAEDHTAAIAAIKAAADIFYRNAKIDGVINDEPTINVNMQMDKMVQSIAQKPSSFAQSVNNIVNKSKSEVIEAEFTEIKDGETR